ncbi:MAG: enoyl-CoA hydratase-related protein, partial [Candidatus Binatia bacterium]
MTTVRVDDREGGVRVLTLDRPPANAENEELLTELGAALDAAAGDDTVRAVVLTGRGKFFSGGFDLGSPRRVEDQERLLTDVFREAHRTLLT